MNGAHCCLPIQPSGFGIGAFGNAILMYRTMHRDIPIETSLRRETMTIQFDIVIHVQLIHDERMNVGKRKRTASNSNACVKYVDSQSS
jgi:hypothetical protein